MVKFNLKTESAKLEKILSHHKPEMDREEYRLKLIKEFKKLIYGMKVNEYTLDFARFLKEKYEL